MTTAAIEWPARDPEPTGDGGAPPVLELIEVTKTYPGDPPLEVLRQVSLTIRTGELVAIIGPSGSGKSTLLHIMGTLDRTTGGRMLVDGQDVGKMGDRQLAALRAHRIGFVFQQFFLLDGMPALDNVADGMLYRGLSRPEREQRAAQALTRVGLGHRLWHHPAQLSGGERQRVAIARALVNEPAIVFADEPTGNLDSATGRAILELLMELNEEGATICVITHDPQVAGLLPRRIELHDGRITADTAASPGPTRRPWTPEPWVSRPWTAQPWSGR